MHRRSTKEKEKKTIISKHIKFCHSISSHSTSKMAVTVSKLVIFCLLFGKEKFQAFATLNLRGRFTWKHLISLKRQENNACMPWEELKVYLNFKLN